MAQQSATSQIYYISLRLCALVGFLFIVEQLGLYVWQSKQSFSTPVAPVVPSHFVPAAIYKDGKLVNSSAPHPKTHKSKAIVAASVVGDNTSWLDTSFPEWESNVYVMNDPDAGLTVTKNKGNEGSAYLSYIISHYHALPDVMVFLHARRYQWHNDDPMYDHIPLLNRLRTSHVTRMGYTNLRCAWEPGCPNEIAPDPEFEDGVFGIRAAYARTFTELFPGEPIPEKVAHQCCAQFALSRDKILEKPVRYYEKIRQWLWETDLHPGRSGRIMEYMWHIIFSMSPVHCPTAEHCYCMTYGLCNLTCHTEGTCDNRYVLPAWDTAIPAEWPEVGQGEGGLPVEGWWGDSPR